MEKKTKWNIKKYTQNYLKEEKQTFVRILKSEVNQILETGLTLTFSTQWERKERNYIKLFSSAADHSQRSLGQTISGLDIEASLTWLE